MEADLVGWFFKFCEFPESFSPDFTIYKVLDIVKNGIISHRTFHDIVVMGITQTTGNDKIQLFL